MPSLAFAGTAKCNYPDANTWEKLQVVLKTDDAKYVKDYVAPTWHTAGSATLICKEDWCGETTTVNFPALCDKTTTVEEFWVEDLAAKYLEQGVFKNELAAKKWADSMKAKGYCRLKGITVHKDCGSINTTLEVATTDAHKKVDHVKPEGTQDCQDYKCKTCGELVKATKNHKYTAPADKAALDKLAPNKVSEPNCLHGSGYEVECPDCKEKFVWYFDKDLGDGTKTDKKDVAHNYGTPVDVKEATTRTTSGKYVVNPGYLAVKYDDTTATEFADAKAYADYTFYKATELVDVDPTDVTCAGNKYGVKCTVCGHVNDSVTPGVCDYEKTHVAATCDHAGYNKLVCKNCGSLGKNEDLSKTEPKLAHSYKVTKTDATCTSGEVYTIECTTCEEDCAKKKEEVKSAGTLDVYEKNTDSTTVLWRGFDKELSTKDAIALTFTNNASKAHKYGALELLKAADCENNEVWGKKCTECGKVNHALVTIKPNTALGHNFVDAEVAATCGTAGYKTSQCSTCGEYKAAEGTTKNAADALKTQTAKPLVAPGSACSYDKWVVTKKATVFEEGVKSLECSVCGNDGSAKTVIAKVKYAAPAVKAGKKSATVTVKATADAVSYKISYKKAGGSYKTIAANAGKKTIKKLAKGKKYTFKAIAVNAEGVEVASATKTVKVK